MGFQEYSYKKVLPVWPKRSAGQYASFYPCPCEHALCFLSHSRAEQKLHQRFIGELPFAEQWRFTSCYPASNCVQMRWYLPADILDMRDFMYTAILCQWISGLPALWYMRSVSVETLFCAKGNNVSTLSQRKQRYAMIVGHKQHKQQGSMQKK